MARKKVNVGQQQFGFPDDDVRTPLHDEMVLWVKRNSYELSKKLLDWSEGWNAEIIETNRGKTAAAVEQCKQDLKKEIGELAERIRRRLPFTEAERLQPMEDDLAALESWAGLGDPPPAQILVSSALEIPLTRERYKAMDILGYADVVFSISVTVLSTRTFPVRKFREEPKLEPNQTSRLGWWTYWDDPRKVALDAKTTIPSLGQLLRQLNTYRAYCSWPFYVVSPEVRFAQHISDEGFGFIEYPEGIFLRPKTASKSP